MRYDAKNTRIYNGLRTAIVLMLVTACLFVSNGSAIVSESSATMQEYPMDDPTPYFYSPDELDNYTSEVDLERDYSNIEAFTEFAEYNAKVKEIYITIRDSNPAKGFYFLMVPFIEKKADDNWIRLNYQEPALGYQTWFLCAIQGNHDKPNETRTVFRSEYLRDKFTAGEYRMVVFVGNLKVYAPFRII
jgi:hypothetical protein